MSLEQLNRLAERIYLKENNKLPGVRIFSRSETSSVEATVYNPVICLILQGKRKRTLATNSFLSPRAMLCWSVTICQSHQE